MRLGRSGSFFSGLIIGAGIGALLRELIQSFRDTTNLASRQWGESVSPEHRDQSQLGGASNSGPREIPIQTSSARKNSKKPKRTLDANTSSTEELH